MHFTLRQLRIFESVARRLNFTRAAQELHLSQPAVSMQIQQLENQLGLRLFDSVGKKISLTDAGAEVLIHVKAINQQLDDLESTVTRYKGVESGTLRIAVATTANYFAPTLLAAFNQRHPNVRISLNVTNRRELLEQLRTNAVDLVIMGAPPPDANLDADEFMDNPLVIVAPPGHPLAMQGRKIPLARLRDEVFLVREHGSGTRSAMERFFAERGIDIKTGMEIGSNEAIKQSVQAGLGLGLLSRDTIEMELKLGRLVELSVEAFPIMRHWYVVSRTRKQLSRVATEFKSFLLSEAKSLRTRSARSERR